METKEELHITSLTWATNQQRKAITFVKKMEISKSAPFFGPKTLICSVITAIILRTENRGEELRCLNIQLITHPAAVAVPSAALALKSLETDSPADQSECKRSCLESE